MYGDILNQDACQKSFERKKMKIIDENILKTGKFPTFPFLFNFQSFSIQTHFAGKRI